MVSIINSLGYGSGLDVPKLIADLSAASREPKAARLEKRTTALQASISAVSRAKSDLDGFATSLANLVSSGKLQSQPRSSDTSIVEASARTGVRLGNFSGTVEVSQLARGQSLVSANFTSATDPIGQGTLTITIGGVARDIAIGTATDSLNGVAAAINAANTGVTANVVSDPTGSRLVFKGQTGSANAFTISSSDAGLSDLAYPGGTTLVQGALDATFKVDGLDYTRGSNVIADVVSGVSLTLKKVAVGEPVTLTSERIADTLKTTVSDFTSVFNELQANIAEAKKATNGDQALRQLEARLARLVSQRVSSSEPGSLAAIGIKTQRDGTLLFDEGVFNAVYAANPDAVEAIFSPTRDATRNFATDPGIAGALTTLKLGVSNSSGVLTGLSSRLSKQAAALSSEREKMESREAAYKTRLEKQFGGLDARVGALKATQSYLDQQVKLWTASK